MDFGFTVSPSQPLERRSCLKLPSPGCRIHLIFLSWEIISLTLPWAINPGNILAKRRRAEGAIKLDNNLPNRAYKLCKLPSLSLFCPPFSMRLHVNVRRLFHGDMAQEESTHCPEGNSSSLSYDRRSFTCILTYRPGL